MAAMVAPLGIFGGTFDPIHLGHLELAREVRDALELAAVRLIPAGDPPHRAAPVATAIHRLAMVELAIEDLPGLEVDRREIDRPGRSYTVLTLESLRAEDSARPLALIVGADAFAGFPDWYRWREISIVVPNATAWRRRRLRRPHAHQRYRRVATNHRPSRGR